MASERNLDFDGIVLHKLAEWKRHLRSIEVKGHLRLELGSREISLPYRRGVHSVYALAEHMLDFEEGRRILAFAGVQKLGLGFVSNKNWRVFQSWMVSRGLPRPPDMEPGYCLFTGSGRRRIAAIMIRIGFESDVATLARESEYATKLLQLYSDNVAISNGAERALRTFLDAQFPGSAPEVRAIKREIFVRLFANLRSRRTLLLCREQGVRMNEFYTNHRIIAGAE